ncbi:hypothetical protein [uncultured Shewanella sp.]|uniref:cyanobactin maturation protease PatG family protein n=1 Tax=uncultured Shewanella sp. TaxID=173975 RepID=UPI0026076D38|nr:hypothetical protein [uncultured Shewanella sp.]
METNNQLTKDVVATEKPVSSEESEGIDNASDSDVIQQVPQEEMIVVDEKPQEPTISVKETFIYAIGQLRPVFPNKGLEKTYLFAAQTLKVSGDDYYRVFSYQDTSTKQRPYLYIAEQCQWVLRIHGVDAYVLMPVSQTEVLQLIDAIKPQESSLQTVYTNVIGYLGPKKRYDNNETSLPSVLCEQLYHQTMDELQQGLIPEASVSTQAIQGVIKQLALAPNHGDTDFQRAVNYMAFRYPAIYLLAHSLQQKLDPVTNGAAYFLVDIQPQYSDVMSNQVIVDIIFKFKNDASELFKFYYCSVNVTGVYPFINSPLHVFMPVEPETV